MRDPTRAGQSAKRMAAARRKTALTIAIASLAALILLTLVMQSKALAGLGGATLVILVLLRVIADVADRKVGQQLKAEKRALRGAVGEEAVAFTLDDLGDAYFPIHDVVSPYGNIDHVVVARSGAIYLIETKSHRGRVESPNGVLHVNGKPPEKDFVGQALRNAAWLGERASSIVGAKVRVIPFLVFTNAFVPRLPLVRGVTIINKRFLGTELARQAAASRTPQAWELRHEIAELLR